MLSPKIPLSFSEKVSRTLKCSVGMPVNIVFSFKANKGKVSHNQLLKGESNNHEGIKNVLQNFKEQSLIL